MLIISFSALNAIVRHACEKRTLIYWRLIVATILMTSIYLLQLTFLSHKRYYHKYDQHDWSDLLLNEIVDQLWPFSVLPTLLYTWQYYDLVDVVSNHKRTKWGIVIRGATVVIGCLCTFSTIVIRDYYYASEIWYQEIFGGHHD
jgi:hypothetical protein